MTQQLMEETTNGPEGAIITLATGDSVPLFGIAKEALLPSSFIFSS